MSRLSFVTFLCFTNVKISESMIWQVICGATGKFHFYWIFMTYVNTNILRGMLLFCDLYFQRYSD